MIRICHLAKYYAPFRGGIETHVQSIARAQRHSGHDVTVACINHLNSDGESVWAERFSRTYAKTVNDNGVVVEKFGKFASFARFDFCTGLVSFLRDAHQHFDILHLHVPNPVFCVALALASPKIPLVVTYHSDIVKQKFTRLPFRFVENSVFSKVKRFIVATNEYAKSSEVLLPYQDRISVIPFGLDLAPYTHPSAEAIRFRDALRAKTNGEPLWLCVGRLVYYKGFEFAVRALPTCSGRLMIVGSGPLKAHLEQLALNLGVADRIDWFDGLTDDELVGAYHAATALWFPSVMRSEAFGLVQIEAMACGCPVINTQIDGSGVPAVSKDGESGITIEVGNHRALSEAANRIDTDRDLRDFLSAGARARASREFSLERMIDSTGIAYHTVLASQKISLPATLPVQTKTVA